MAGGPDIVMSCAIAESVPLLGGLQAGPRTAQIGLFKTVR